MKAIVTIRSHTDSSFWLPRVEIRLMPDPRGLMEMAQEEISLVSDPFRCFICTEKKDKAEFAGMIRYQYICKKCLQTTDSGEVRGLISFDLRHGIQVRMFPKAKWGKNFSTKKDPTGKVQRIDQWELAKKRQKVEKRRKESNDKA